MLKIVNAIAVDAIALSWSRKTNKKMYKTNLTFVNNIIHYNYFTGGFSRCNFNILIPHVQYLCI